MNKCAQCGESLADKAVVCHICGFLVPAPDDFQLAPVTGERPSGRPLLDDLIDDADDDGTEAGGPKPIRVREAYDFEADRKFQDYGLPSLLLVAALIAYVVLSVRIFGPRGAGAVALDLSFLLLLEIPLAVGLLTVTGIVFGISLGWLSSGVLKLTALGLGNRAFTALVIMLALAGMEWQAFLVGVMGVAFLLWFTMTVFDLTISEMLVIWLANWIYSALLYAAFRFLFQLPGLF